MSTASTIQRDMYTALMTDPGLDPGSGGTFNVNRDRHTFALVSGGAEARTLPAPTVAGVDVFMYMKTDGGDITLTITGGYNEDGDTTFVFSDPGQFLHLRSVEVSTTAMQWRKISDHAMAGLSLTEAALLNGVTSTTAELNYLDQNLATNILTRGAGVDTSESYVGAISRSGGLITTTIVLDLSTLIGSATDLDIIGESAAASCHWGQITTAKSGTLIGGQVTCLEVPAGGSADIDFYSANESTGAQDALVTSLTETILITAGGAWTSGAVKGMTTLPPANDYLYIVNGAASGGTFTAGKFLIELFGV